MPPRKIANHPLQIIIKKKVLQKTPEKNYLFGKI